ncbi:hypothetical protein P153DRAFT_15915 [Dothidotthia symphoricarpi CBS 119687]|uniref:Uncharacterized protein n=1 Tax=Dothidotthia symphoricarpi CBS 119687 TaxID=1392245 RepID=A0A6A6ABR6_9PLEO|nr:uncharacterized protein P153DRAFT_15915 [Dothidotthia symphoricarpi CBS 119687]KAF2129239.1 hypothetical protein P153DRAFT_15915 [Dothidotthia symphoricarpi CBS 119687]
MPRPSSQRRQPNLSDFYYQGPLTALVKPSPETTTAWVLAAHSLRESRARFATKIKVGGDQSVCALDRSAVLDVYQEALKNISPANYQQITSETNLKVKTILNIRPAEPDDLVFSTVGALLRPLDPQYADPRIEYEHDLYGYRAAWRLDAWRKQGWPHEYPRGAVEAEKTENAQPPHGRGSLANRDRKNKIMGMSDEALGGVVTKLIQEV